MRRNLARALGWIIAVLGGFFAVAGAVLLSLHGSPYYLIAGLVMIASGALVGRDDVHGRWLFVGIWIGTLVWAIWEVGFDGLQLVPRIVRRPFSWCWSCSWDGDAALEGLARLAFHAPRLP